MDLHMIPSARCFFGRYPTAFGCLGLCGSGFSEKEGNCVDPCYSNNSKDNSADNLVASTKDT